MRGFLSGLLAGLLLVPIGALVYFHFGHPPVGVADPAFPFERQITHAALGARIDAEAPKSAPIEPSPANLEAGARIYRDQCAACHGLSPTASSFGRNMYPHAPQLWHGHGDGVVGVSDDPPGETFWKVDNGIRLTGMPSYRNVLTPTQEWQVSLLLANANKPLPPDAQYLLQQPLFAQPATPPAPAAAVATPATNGSNSSPPQ